MIRGTACISSLLLGAERRTVRIRFLLPSGAPTGGVQVVLRHAVALRTLGHEVLVFWPATRLPRLGDPDPVHALKTWWRSRHVDRTWEILRDLQGEGLAHEVESIIPSTIPAGDVLVATAWTTAEWLAAFPASHGARSYFLQGYEAYSPAMESRVDATWRLPFARIALSEWLIRLGHERLGVDCAGPIGNGIDLDRFHPPASPRPALPVRIGAVYDPLPKKGLPILLDVLDRVAARRPDVDFLLFGRSRRRHRFPARTRFVFNPKWDEIPALLGTCHLFLHASLEEGWGLPPMEAMACECATVATRSGGVPEFADESSAYITEPGDASAMVEATLELLDDADRRTALGIRARAHLRNFTWGEAHARLEAALLDAARQGTSDLR